MHIRPLLCLLGVVTLVTACGGGDDDDDATSTTAGGAATATTMDPAMDMSTSSSAPAETVAPAAGSDPATTGGGAASAENTVEIVDFAFGPEQLEVAVGATITFVNNDSQAHTATAAGVFDTGSIAPGESATVTIEAAGTFDYICGFHPFMTGSIVAA